MNVGLIGTATVTVAENNTAKAVGSGLLPVYSTPSMIALLEMAACNAIADSLDEGTSSVGTQLNIKHLAAAYDLGAVCLYLGIEGVEVDLGGFCESVVYYFFVQLEDVLSHICSFYNT